MNNYFFNSLVFLPLMCTINIFYCACSIHWFPYPIALWHILLWILTYTFFSSRFRRIKSKVNRYQNFQPAVTFHNKDTASIAFWHSLLLHSKRWRWRILRGRKRPITQWIPNYDLNVMSFLCTKDKIFDSYRQSEIYKLEKKIQSLGKFAYQKAPWDAFYVWWNIFIKGMMILYF